MPESNQILSSDRFYDVIADEYNGYMTTADNAIREIVKEHFKDKVQAGNVLDFGGGTGLDLRWLTESGYTVFQLEPSEKMREEAKALSISFSNKPHFIEDNIDFHSWNNDVLPTEAKMDGIVANFAVLNCIRDIDVLLERLSLISNSGCYLFATVIDSTPKALIKHYGMPVVLRSLLNMKAIVYSNYKNTGHRTYLHTLSHYKKASNKYYNFISYTPLGYSNMSLLILSKK